VTSHLDLNPDILQQILRQPETGKALQVITDAMAADAKQHAPVEHGDYRDAIIGRVWQDSLGWHGALVGDNFKTVFIEHGVTGAGRSGDVNFPALHIFLNASKSTGLKTNEELA
jgi:hypothetical protein